MSDLSELPVLSDSGPDPWLTTGQVAALCAVDPRTVARWIDLGYLPSHRTAGGRRRVLRSDVLDFMKVRGIPVCSDPSPERLRIAVIDDDVRVVKAMLRTLNRLVPSAECRAAHDGFRAGALLVSFRPQLVFLDVVMPGMSGIEVCECIRSTPGLEQSVIVIVSGQLTPNLCTRLEAGGATTFIAKPCTAVDVAAVVSGFLRNSHVQSRLSSEVSRLAEAAP